MQTFKEFLGEALHAYDVHHKGKHIDTIFYGHPEPVEDVKKSLINHDGYHPNITVTKQRTRKSVKEEAQVEEGLLSFVQKKIVSGVEARHAEHKKAAKTLHKSQFVKGAVGPGSNTLPKAIREASQLTELTSSTLKNYIKKSSQDLNVQSSLRAHYARDYDKKTSTPADAKLMNKKHTKVTARLKGIGQAADQLQKRAARGWAPH